MRHWIGGIAVGITLCLGAVACSNFDNLHSVTVELPRLPAAFGAYRRSARFLVCHPDGRGGEVTTTVSLDETTIELAIPTWPVVPVLALPLLTENGTLSILPAGGLYPLDKRFTGTLPLSWHQGFVAKLLCDLAAGGLSIEALNATRLSSAIELKGRGNPWKLDSEAITDQLLYGGFGIANIRLLPQRPLTIGNVGGLWYSNNPLEPSPLSAFDGFLTLLVPSRGLEAYYRPETGEWLDILSDGSGWLYVNNATGDGGSGRW